VLHQLNCGDTQLLCFKAKLFGGWLILTHGNHDVTLRDAEARLWIFKLTHYQTAGSVLISVAAN
jgi:hypothetical protein